MEGPRIPTADEFTHLVKFLDDHLRPGQGWSVAQEYPTALTTKNLHNFRIITESQKIVSHAVIRPTIVKTRRGLFKIGCIGSVVTDENYRNQGHSQAVMQDCLEAVKQQGCDFAMLWTNLYDFYRKFGFEIAGTEVSLQIGEGFQANHGKTFRIVEGPNIDPQAFLRIYVQHTVSSVRTLDEIEKYLKIPNSHVYTAWDNDGRMVAYAVEGKGADLQGYIHEWGGSVEPLLTLFQHIHKAQSRVITVIVPAHSQNLIRSAEKAGAHRIDGFLGMIKITNPQSLFGKVMRSARQEFGIQDFVIEKRGDDIYFGTADNLYKTNHEADIVRLLFGPQKPSKQHDYGPEMNKVLDQIFPLEMWVWGWESV